MADQSNLARPYAQAVFELAKEQGDLAAWSDQLDLLAAIAADPATQELVNNPQVSADQIGEFFQSVAGANLSESAANLIKLVVRNDRVSALPDIAKAYAEKRAEAESTVEAEMVTATEISEQQQQQFASVLEKKLGRSVKLSFDVDEDLIGGAVIRAGDWVLDGSVKSQLDQLVGAIGS
ncbi:MAG: F0F1 ATP synthase subunit delta [Pseudomonadota bacterium]